MADAVKDKPWSFLAFQTAPANPQLEKDFLTMAASLAARSSHPSASELMRVARLNGCPRCDVIGFKDFPGEGFGGAVQLPGEAYPRPVLIGTRAFLAQSGLETPALLEVALRRWEEEGARVLLGGWDRYVRGVMKFSAEAAAPTEPREKFPYT